jgi:hypothetical protein
VLRLLERVEPRTCSVPTGPAIAGPVPCLLHDTCSLFQHRPHPAGNRAPRAPRVGASGSRHHLRGGTVSTIPQESCLREPEGPT